MSGPGAMALAGKINRLLLLAQPRQESLKLGVGLDLVHCVQFVPQLIVIPGLVDKILAGLAGGHCLPATLALWDDMMPTRLNAAATKDALNFWHRIAAYGGQISHNLFGLFVGLLHPYNYAFSAFFDSCCHAPPF